MLEKPAEPDHAPAPRPARGPVGGRAGPGREVEPISGYAVLAALHRRWGALVACIVLVPVLAFIALRQTTPRYTATGALLYDPSEYKPRELQSILRVDPTTEAVMASQAEILRSLRAVERIAHRLDLAHRPEFGVALRPAPEPLRLIREVIAFLAPADTEPSRQAVPSAIDPAKAAMLLRVQHAIEVRTVNASRVLEVSFTAEDPALAAAVVESLMQIYMQDQLDAKLEAVRAAQTWLERRATDLRAEVRAAEDKIALYRARQGLVQGEHAPLDAEQMSNLTEGLAHARSELAAAQGRLAAARDGSAVAAEAAVAPSVVQQRGEEVAFAAQLRSMLVRLGPNHPDVRAAQRQLDELRRSVGAAQGRVVAATEAEVRAAQARVNALEEDLAQAQTRAEIGAEAQIPLNAMERDAEASRNLLQSVLGRLQETVQQAAVERPDARELSRALPPVDPSFPRARPMLAAAAAFGLLFGLLVVYLLEISDTSLRSGEDARALFDLPCLALVPEITRRALGHVAIEEYVCWKPLTPFAEQIRALRASLWLGAARPGILAVTAARPSEGKTTLTVSLGRSAALSGERVVVIDCDIRRPTLARLLDAPTGPGLAECLRGAATLEEILRKDPLTGMAYIPAGTAEADTLALFMSERMGQMLRSLREDYELVLMDAPPAHAMADTRAIAQVADATLFCVRWRLTPRAVVASALELLEAADARVGGIVLTRVDARAHRRSGFADAEACHPRYGQYHRG
jgi:polysaccharide biosynthesis transport protein